MVDKICYRSDCDDGDTAEVWTDKISTVGWLLTGDNTETAVDVMCLMV